MPILLRDLVSSHKKSQRHHFYPKLNACLKGWIIQGKGSRHSWKEWLIGEGKERRWEKEMDWRIWKFGWKHEGREAGKEKARNKINNTLQVCSKYPGFKSEAVVLSTGLTYRRHCMSWFSLRILFYLEEDSWIMQQIVFDGAGARWKCHFCYFRLHAIFNHRVTSILYNSIFFYKNIYLRPLITISISNDLLKRANENNSKRVNEI